MDKLQLVISPAAQDDLRKVYRYGVGMWGETQASIYLDGFKKQFSLLTEQPFIGIARHNIARHLRSLSLPTHLIFYRHTNNQVEIVRILHERQDPERQLANLSL